MTPHTLQCLSYNPRCNLRLPPSRPPSACTRPPKQAGIEVHRSLHSGQTEGGNARPARTSYPSFGDVDDERRGDAAIRYPDVNPEDGFREDVRS